MSCSAGSESIASTVGELSAPPSADQPKHLTTPTGIRSAWGVTETVSKSDFGVFPVEVHPVPLANVWPRYLSLQERQLTWMMF